MPRMFMAVRREQRHPLTEILGRTPEIPPGCQWGIFLRNHDELTLEMVTDEERDYMWAEYAKDPRMKRNIGIGRRLAPLVDNDRRVAELLHALLFSFPGSPILYYGDEIAMGDNIYLGDRDGVRTPMQWSPDRNAGFSTADFAQLYLPPLMDPVYGYQAVNVEAGTRNPSSFLYWMKRMLEVRKQHPVFGLGSFEVISVDNPSVLAYVRTLDPDEADAERSEAVIDADSFESTDVEAFQVGPGGVGTSSFVEAPGPALAPDVVLCVCNLSKLAQPAELPLQRWEGKVPIELLGRVPFPRIGELPYFVTLAPYGFYWFELVDPPGGS
ncbi:MAG: alpha-glucosidase C-terminal domain-containing protein, partial [Acidimicrobiales bacterium]|nr:alpha-glucosidase C-terminal domain-containing protein [Acidimicrobiales bacterium]